MRTQPVQRIAAELRRGRTRRGGAEQRADHRLQPPRAVDQGNEARIPRQLAVVEHCRGQVARPHHFQLGGHGFLRHLRIGCCRVGGRGARRDRGLLLDDDGRGSGIGFGHPPRDDQREQHADQHDQAEHDLAPTKDRDQLAQVEAIVRGRAAAQRVADRTGVAHRQPARPRHCRHPRAVTGIGVAIIRHAFVPGTSSETFGKREHEAAA